MKTQSKTKTLSCLGLALFAFSACEPKSDGTAPIHLRPSLPSSPVPLVSPEPISSVRPEPTPLVRPEPTPLVRPAPTPLVHPAPTPLVHPAPTPLVHPAPTPLVHPEPTPAPVASPEPPAERYSLSPEPRSHIRSRFDCVTAMTAAKSADEVYNVINNPESVQSERHPRNFQIFQATTGGVVGVPTSGETSNFGFVEYRPSDLERALDDPNSGPLDWNHLNFHREARLTFRGTMGTFSGPDWRTNRDLGRGDVSVLRSSQYGQDVERRYGHGYVHNGFLTTYLSAREQLTRHFEESFVQRSRDLEVHLRRRLLMDPRVSVESINPFVERAMSDYQIIIDGHSLGGALATLAAYDFAIHYPEYRSKLSLITFAAPGVFDTATVQNSEGQAISSLQEFSQLMAHGTEYGHDESVIFFERPGDIVSASTQRHRRYSLNPAGRFLYHGAGEPFEGRPDNSGIIINLEDVEGARNRSVVLLNYVLHTVSFGFVSDVTTIFSAHSMEDYKNDIVNYCERVSHEQECLNFGSLSQVEQERCIGLGIDSTRAEYLSTQLSETGVAHVMDLPVNRVIPRRR